MPPHRAARLPELEPRMANSAPPENRIKHNRPIKKPGKDICAMAAPHPPKCSPDRTNWSNRGSPVPPKPRGVPSSPPIAQRIEHWFPEPLVGVRGRASTSISFSGTGFDLRQRSYRLLSIPRLCCQIFCHRQHLEPPLALYQLAIDAPPSRMIHLADTRRMSISVAGSSGAAGGESTVTGRSEFANSGRFAGRNDDGFFPHYSENRRSWHDLADGSFAQGCSVRIGTRL